MVARGINNTGTHAALTGLLRAQETHVQSTLSAETLSQNPLVSCWRKAFKSFKEDKDRSSIEALLKRVLKGNAIPSISPLVDAYNVVSLKYLLPIGGEDCAALQEFIELRLAAGQESFKTIGGTQNDPPWAGEVIYADADGAVCRKWNWRECDRTKITPQTQDAFMVIDAIPPANEALVKAALAEMNELVERFTQARTETFLLNAQNSTIEF
ncbi:MAG: hypothetical protein HY917_03070 [Candidatus Diapherotrites archaeon]|nr:hypothetical protein [Candidatus Diapherotrites archaeon]